jgi:DNA-binding response OmpR family regulator
MGRTNVYILVVDDNQFGNALVHFALTKEGFEVQTLDNPRQAMQMIQKREPDLLLLDIAMPHMDGFEFSKKLHDEGYDIPIIFMTARDSLEDKLHGFHMGADDYICKPFNHQELAARVHAVMRRITKSNNLGNDSIHRGRFELFPAELKLTTPERPAVLLTPKEMQVLRMLMIQPGHAVTRENLLAEIWNEDESNSNIVDVYVRRLRRKVEHRADKPEHILSIRGIGYKFVEK